MAKNEKKDPQTEDEKRLIRMGIEEVVAAEHAAEGKIGKPPSGQRGERVTRRPQRAQRVEDRAQRG